MDEVTARIEKRAYELWERAGRPWGGDVDCWIEAERQIALEMAEVSRAPPLATAR